MEMRYSRFAEEIDDLGRRLELVGAELRNFQPGQVTTPVAPTAPPIPPPAYQFDGTARATILLGEAILLVLVALWAVNKIALLGALASR